MKKTQIIAIGMMLFLCSHMSAQSQYYFKVGDTIHGRDTIYHYQWWSEDWLNSDTTHHLTLTWFMYDTAIKVNGYPVYTSSEYTKEIIVRYCYTEQPLKIVGIATASYFGHSSDFFTHPTPIPDNYPMKTEYLEIFDADTGRDPFPRVVQLEYDYYQPPRYMTLDVRCGLYPPEWCKTRPCELVNTVEIREFYLDKPVTVYDSFYVGHTTNNNRYLRVCWPELEGVDLTNGVITFQDRYIGWESRNRRMHPDCIDTTCENAPLNRYKYRLFYTTDANTCDTVDPSWHWCESHYFMLDFPIVEIDSSFYDGPPQYVCPSVENFRVGNEGEGSVVLLWHNHNDHLRWEVSYGPQGIAPEDGTQLIAAIPAIQIANLDSCTHYTAYIRAVCMHDSLHYSEWSEPLDICLCDTGGAAAIEVPLLERLTYLMPNPAADQVQVLSSYGMTRVEAYSLQGTKMADLRVRGLGATLDVADWPQGMYIVVVHTPAGNVTKKLVVGR